jgi:hypothetical protein
MSYREIRKEERVKEMGELKDKATGIHRGEELTA